VADNVTLPPSGTGDLNPKAATEQVVADGSHKQFVQLAVPGTGTRVLIPASAANGLTVDVTRIQGSVTVNLGLTDAQLRASAVPVDVSDRAARLLGVVSGAANVFHVDDNAGSLTVDAPVGTPVASRLSDGAAFYKTNVDTQLPAALVGGRLSVDASGVAVPVTDNAGSLTVDAPVATPVFVRLSDGAAALIGQKTMAASLPVALASDQTLLPAVSEQRAATLHVTGTAAVNTAVTVTLPAVASQFHYITSIQVVKLYSVIGVAAGAGVILTSTNLPGNPAWTTEQLASAAGTAVKVLDYQPTTPLKSSVANTATTIVCPVQLQTIWRVNVSYFTAV
jgi:hypothetical protein